jgi:hypothetical protein
VEPLVYHLQRGMYAFAPGMSFYLDTGVSSKQLLLNIKSLILVQKSADCVIAQYLYLLQQKKVAEMNSLLSIEAKNKGALEEMVKELENDLGISSLEPGGKMNKMRYKIAHGYLMWLCNQYILTLPNIVNLAEPHRCCMVFAGDIENMVKQYAIPMCFLRGCTVNQAAAYKKFLLMYLEYKKNDLMDTINAMLKSSNR